MDKRTIIAIVLIFIVYWLFNQFIWAPKNNQNQAATENVQQAEATAETVSPDSISIPGKPAGALAMDTSVEAELVTLENDKLALTFSTLGACITKAVVKDYPSMDRTKFVQLIPEEQRTLCFENIPIETSAGDIDIANMIYQVETTDNGITFFLADDDGNRLVEKVFRLSADYRLEVDFNVNIGQDIEHYNLAFESGLRDTEAYLKHKKNDYKIVTMIDNSIESIMLSKLMKEPRELNGNIDWAGVRTKYFGIAVIPDNLLHVNQLYATDRGESPGMSLHVDNSDHPWEIRHHYSVFVGPLIASMLEDEFGMGMENLAEIGWKWLQFLSKFFLWFLEMLHKFIPNYGIDIIIFAIVIKIVVYPLTHKTLESGQKMQKIQPKVKEIQQKYKGDPRTMNAEVQKLYKEHGVSPLGGCLPTLLQMPILFALYPALRYSIELRQANFFFWLNDLSAPDPYYVLPILMGVFMFVQQKMMSPQTQSSDSMDDQQKAAAQTQKMMLYVMPVMMVWIFAGLSSGLVLYWTIFNILSIGQMYIMGKRKKAAAQN